MVLRVALGSLLAAAVLLGASVHDASAAPGRDDDHGHGRPEFDDRGRGNDNRGPSSGPGNSDDRGPAPAPAPTAPPPVSVAPRPVPLPASPPVGPVVPPVTAAAPVAPPVTAAAPQPSAVPSASSVTPSAPAPVASPTAGPAVTPATPANAATPPRNDPAAAGRNVEPVASPPAHVSSDAASSGSSSDGRLVSPRVPAEAGLPFEFPLASGSTANGPSPLGLVLLGGAAVALIILLFGPRGRGLVGYWTSEARLALLSRRRSGG
jgi:hypothetical protein